MRATEILLEGPEDILKSFFSLTKSDGKFKSEKQKNFLLSQCNDGEGVFRLVQNLRFGEHGGASAQVDWVVQCDNEGVTKIIKSTPKKGQSIYWERTPEHLAKQAAKQEAKKKAQQEDTIRHYSDMAEWYKRDLPELDKAVEVAKNEFERSNSPEILNKLIDILGKEEAEEVIARTKKRLDDAISKLEFHNRLIKDAEDKAATAAE